MPAIILIGRIVGSEQSTTLRTRANRIQEAVRPSTSLGETVCGLDVTPRQNCAALHFGHSAKTRRPKTRAGCGATEHVFGGGGQREALTGGGIE
ncbi:MAG TPA: hypothetical protein VIV60_10405 [Polyangiaceae bacterium]